MGGAASAAKRAPPGPPKQIVEDTEILKTASVKKQRRFRVSNGFAIGDKWPRPLDPDVLAEDGWNVLLGRDRQLKLPDSLAVEQLIRCKESAANCVGYTDTVLRLSEFLAGGDQKSEPCPVMCLTGAASSGVSTVIAKAILASAPRLESANVTLVYREIDASISTAQLVISSIKEQVGAPIESMREVLAAGTRDNPLVLVLDGLNHLTDNLCDASLEWLIPALRDCTNRFTRVLLSTTPYPYSPVELSLCRSLASCTVIPLPSLTIPEAVSFLEGLYAQSKMESLDVSVSAEVLKSLQLAATAEFGGITPCYLKLLVSGILYPHSQSKPGCEILPDPIPASTHEAFEVYLSMLEHTFPMEAPATSIHSRPSKSEVDARRNMTSNILSVITLSRYKRGLTVPELAQLMPPSTHAQSGPKPVVSVEKVLSGLASETVELDSHLRAKNDGRWDWTHSVARVVAGYRYHGLTKPSDAYGTGNPDDSTRFLASSYSNMLAAQKRSHAVVSAVCAKEQAYLYCVAQKKNDLLDVVLDIRFLTSMIKAWGGSSGCLHWLQIFRRFALVERGAGIFLRRDRMDEFEAVIYLMGRFGDLFDVGAREQKIDIVLKQLIYSDTPEHHAALRILDTFFSRLSKKDDQEKVNQGRITRQNSANSVIQMKTMVADETYWLFEQCRDCKVDALGQDPIGLVCPSGSPVTLFVTSADGRFIVALVGSNQIRTFEGVPFRELWTHITDESISAIAVSPSGKLTALATYSRIVLFKTGTGSKFVTISTLDDGLSIIPNDPSLPPFKNISITHMKFLDESSLLISSQVGLIYCWRVSQFWTSAQCFKAPEIEIQQEANVITTKFSVSADGFTAVWWMTMDHNGSSESLKQTTKLAVYDMSLETPSNALSQRVVLEVPSVTAPVEFDIVESLIVVVEDDSLYCIDAKTGNLQWSLTSLNAGLTGDWVNVCFFKDLDNEEAVVGVTADGWAVDVTKGYVRWRMYLGLNEGDSVTGAKALNGHIPKQKYNHQRNQLSYGQHIVFSTKRGGLFSVPIYQFALGLKQPALLSPVIERVVSVSCDCVDAETVSADSKNVLHISSAQQIKAVNDDETILKVSIVNSVIVVVTSKGVLVYPKYDSANTEEQCSALLSTPKMYTHSCKILLGKAVAVGLEDSPSTSLLVLDERNFITVLSIDPDPAVMHSFESDFHESDPAAILIPGIVKTLDQAGAELSILKKTYAASKRGRIASFSIPDLPRPENSESSIIDAKANVILSENIFLESGCIFGVPGIRSPEVTCAEASLQTLCVGDSLGNVLIARIGDTDVTEGSTLTNGLKVHHSKQCFPIVAVKWLTISELLSVDSTGVVLVWRLDFEEEKAFMIGAVDGCGSGVPTCVDRVMTARNDSGEETEFRLCIGTLDGRVNELVLKRSDTTDEDRDPDSVK
ncbi:hypothetical protein HDU83_004656 [Entophlyctis luteolus]|nr:hypothetical protein HDU83_004656 [Entophlyctis luteolus]